MKPQAPATAFPRRTEQGDHEQEQHHHRARVDDDLDDEDELSAEEQEQHRQRQHHDDQAEHRSDRLAERDHTDAAGDREQGGDEEDGDRQSYFCSLDFSRASTSGGSGSSSFSLVKMNFSRLTSDISYSGPSTMAWTGQASSQ